MTRRVEGGDPVFRLGKTGSDYLFAECGHQQKSKTGAKLASNTKILWDYSIGAYCLYKAFLNLKRSSSLAFLRGGIGHDCFGVFSFSIDVLLSVVFFRSCMFFFGPHPAYLSEPLSSVHRLGFLICSFMVGWYRGWKGKERKAFHIEPLRLILLFSGKQKVVLLWLTVGKGIPKGYVYMRGLGGKEG
jgi:hypothetical protein